MNWSQSEAVNELAAALAKAQSEIRGAVADSDNPFYKSKYADLASVWDACRKQLTAQGLSVVQLPVTTEHGTGISTVLMHSSGQWIGSTVYATAKDSGPQAIGSVLTYLRRYSLAAVAGVPQVDDDGEGGEGRTKTATEPPREQAPAPPVKTPTRTTPATEQASGDGVYITNVKEASGGAGEKAWHAYIVSFSDGREAGIMTKDDNADAIIAHILEAVDTQKAVVASFAPSKRDASKLKIVNLDLAENVLV